MPGTTKGDDLSKPEIFIGEEPEDIAPKYKMPAPPESLVIMKPNKADRIILRLNKLFEPTKSLGPVLSTFNYSLYLLAYLDNRFAALAKRALHPASYDVPVKDSMGSLDGSLYSRDSSSFARLGSVLENTRMTLRLFGLLPVYVKMRKLLQEPIAGMDTMLHTISVAQCALYGVYQLLENVAFLTEIGVISSRFIERWTKSGSGRTARLFKLAHRAWFLSVLCDFVRLFRIGQLVVSGSSSQIDGTVEKDQRRIAIKESSPSALPRWIRPMAWLPIAWQLSAWSAEDDASHHVGVRGAASLHMGVRGTAGILADLGKTIALWNETESVIN